MNYVKLYFVIMCFVLSCGDPSIDGKNSLYKEKADDYYKEKSYMKALKLYNLVLQKDSLNKEVLFRRASCLSHIGKINESNRDYFKVIKLNYRLEDAYTNLGCNFAEFMDYKSAIYYFIEALKLNPDNDNLRKVIKMYSSTDSIKQQLKTNEPNRANKSEVKH